MRSLLGFFLMSLATSFCALMFFKKDILQKDIEAQIVQKIWYEDIKKLHEAKQLPLSWWQIKEVKTRALSKKSARWLKSIAPPVTYNPNGDFQLEITIDHNEEPNSLAIIVNYSLNDLKTKNTLWEFGRTYVIPNKKWIDRGQIWLGWIRSFFPDQKEYSSELLSPPQNLEEDHNETPH